MKKTLLKFLLLVSALVVMSTGCAKDPVTDDKDSPSAEFTITNISPSSVEISAKTKSAVRYAYSVTSDANSTAPDAAIIFADINKVGTLEDGVNTFKILDLNPETKYRIFVCAEFTKNDSPYFGQVEEIGSAETVSFEGFVTFVPTNEKHTVKFWINVPEKDTLAFRLIDAADYDKFSLLGKVPASYLAEHEGMLNFVYESQMVTFKGWKDADGAMYPPLPGQPLQFIVGQVTKLEKRDFYGRVVFSPKFDFAGYRAGLANDKQLSDSEFWDNPELNTMGRAGANPPTISPEELIEIKVVHTTTKSAFIEINPHESVANFGYLFMPQSWWTEHTEKYGADGAMYYAQLNSYFDTESLELTATDLDPKVDYRITAFAKLNDDATLISITNKDLKVNTPSKPAPNIVVTAISDPTGENSPWKVWFNIKSTTKDVKAIKMACNYEREWVIVFNTGFDYSDMIEAYGIYVNDPSIISKVNSSEGYNKFFHSWENTESTLAVQTINDEEHASNPDVPGAGDIPYITSKSAPLPDAPRVESTLFEELKGTWTATAHRYIMAPNPATGAFEYVLSETPKLAEIIITDAIEHPANLSQEHYDIYNEIGKDKAETDELFEDFKKSSDKFSKATRGQNRLICLGLDLADRTSTFYESPFDLFVHKTYSRAMTSDDLFYDFGPKWFLEIDENDAVTIPLDQFKVMPLSNWGGGPLYNYAAPLKGEEYLNSEIEFTTTISADRNSITINPIVKNGITHYFSAGTALYGKVEIEFICGKIVLTRGGIPADSAKPATIARKHRDVNSPNNVDNSYNMVRFDKIKNPKPKHVKKEISINEFMKRYKASLSSSID